jgi:lysophospholipid acyltransferase
MEAVEVFFANLSGQLGFPVDQLKFITCLLACYPAAFLFKALPASAPNVKHAFSILMSIGMTTFCLGFFECIHSFISALVTYLLLWFLPVSIGYRVAFAWAFGYMSVSHLYRQYVDYMGWTLDFTTMQMVLTIKLTSFCFNYYDGRCAPELRSAEQRKRGIARLPSLLEYYGFVYFFPSYLAGPAIEITEYQQLINEKLFDDQNCRGKVPSTIVPSLLALLKGLACLPLVIVSGFFPVNYLVSEAFLHAPFLERAGRIWLHTVFCRQRYYFGWFLAEGACNASGIGYNGVDKKTGKSLWDRCSNMDMLKVELAPNIRSITTFWNMRTGDWLKNYVYLRLTPEGQKPTLVSTVATYGCSAFWHGFYPGYYLFFLMSAIVTEVAKDARRVLRPLFVTADDKPKFPHKIIYDGLTIFTTVWFLNYLGASFLLLSFGRALTLYNNVYWFGHVLVVLAFVVLRFGFPPKRAPRPNKDGEKKAQ